MCQPDLIGKVYSVFTDSINPEAQANKNTRADSPARADPTAVPSPLRQSATNVSPSSAERKPFKTRQSNKVWRQLSTVGRQSSATTRQSPEADDDSPPYEGNECYHEGCQTQSVVRWNEEDGYTCAIHSTAGLSAPGSRPLLPLAPLNVPPPPWRIHGRSFRSATPRDRRTQKDAGTPKHPHPYPSGLKLEKVLDGLRHDCYVCEENKVASKTAKLAWLQDTAGRFICYNCRYKTWEECCECPSGVENRGVEIFGTYRGDPDFPDCALCKNHYGTMMSLR